MAATLLGLALAFGSAAFAVYLTNPQWASNHAWIAPWLSGAAGLFTVLSILAWRFRRTPVVKPTEIVQTTYGHSSPAIVAHDSSTVHVNYGSKGPEPEKRPYVKPVEYCETIEAEFIRVINEGERAYDLYTEPLLIGEWVINLERVPELKGEGRITVLRLIKQPQNPRDISTLQKLDTAWRATEKVNVNFQKPWVRIHYKDHKDKPFLSQCRISQFRDVQGNLSFRFFDFSDLPDEQKG